MELGKLSPRKSDGWAAQRLDDSCYCASNAGHSQLNQKIFVAHNSNEGSQLELHYRLRFQKQDATPLFPFNTKHKLTGTTSEAFHNTFTTCMATGKANLKK